MGTIITKDKKSISAWMEAATHNNKSTIMRMLSEGFDVNTRSDDGHTAVMHASFENNVGILKILIDNSADLNIKSESGFTALFYSCVNSNLECSDLLIRNGADVNVKLRYNQTLPMVVKDIFSLELLIVNMVDITASDDLGNTIAEHDYEYLWRTKRIQECIILNQPERIKYISNRFGINHDLVVKYNLQGV